MNDIVVEDLSMIYRYKKSVSNHFFSKKILCEKVALDNVSFCIGRGDVVGYVGLNGAGKTTTMKILSGIIKKTSGMVRVLDSDPFEKSNTFLTKIGLVMGGKCSLYWDLSVNDSLEFNKKIYNIADGDYAKIKNQLVEILKMGNLLNSQVRRLSLGERMKAELLATLIHYPQVVFLDEPTIGLDIVAQNEIRKFLREYNKKWESTIVLTSHNIDDITEVCNKLMLIEQGKMYYSGTINNFMDQYGGKIAKITVSKNVDELISKAKVLLLPIIKVEGNEIFFDSTNENLFRIQAIWKENLDLIVDVSIENNSLKDIIAKMF